MFLDEGAMGHGRGGCSFLSDYLLLAIINIIIEGCIEELLYGRWVLLGSLLLLAFTFVIGR